MKPASKTHGETRPVWKDYEREKQKVFGWIKATGWKPDVPPGAIKPEKRP